MLKKSASASRGKGSTPKRRFGTGGSDAMDGRSGKITRVTHAKGRPNKSSRVRPQFVHGRDYPRINRRMGFYQESESPRLGTTLSSYTAQY